MNRLAGIVRGATRGPAYGRNSIRLACALVLTGGLASWPTAAAAQQAPVPTRESLQPPPPGGAPIVAGSTIDSADAVERSACPLDSPDLADVRFVLQSVTFRGAEAIDASLLTDSWAEYRGQSVPLATICDIRDRAATALRARGFLAAVRVPEQTIEGGVITLDILAARVARVTVLGDAGASEPLLARYLAKLEGQPVFNAAEAERYLLLARDIPGIDARMALRPGGAPGEVIAEVQVRRTQAMFDANIQNLGTRDVGRWTGALRGRFFGLTGLGDQTTLAYFATADFQEQHVVQFAHDMRLGSEGFTLGGGVSYAWTRPDLAGLPIRSETLLANVQASYPLVLRQAKRLTIAAGLELIDQDISLGGIALNRDRLRVASVRLDSLSVDANSLTGRGGYSAAEPRWLLSRSIGLRKGLGFLGASNSCGPLGAACLAPGAVPLTRIEGKPTAFVARFTGYSEWRPTPLLTLAMTSRAQWTDQPLLAFEEFSAGNYTIGRGFDPGTLIGDKGAAVSVEARYLSLVPPSRDAVMWQPFVFFDTAAVRNKDSAFAGVGTQRLYSAGGGLRAVWGDRARFDVAVAVPLNRAGFQTQRGDARILFNMTTQFGVAARN